MLKKVPDKATRKVVGGRVEVAAVATTDAKGSVSSIPAKPVKALDALR